LAHLLGEFCVEEGNGDDDELDGHQVAEHLEDNLEDWPFLGLHEPPATWGEDEGVPRCDSKCAYEEILVGTEMRGQIEVCGEQRRDIVSTHCDCRRRDR
jgi:hypothetical protein